ncbi:NUDIX hydrolase [Pseudonocardia lacus]|uniref:NUDIX hydrolase n=1 Tax=Pseudonocardia lacus TaxID=2835865 RepID=UPI0027E25499|nr:NUDIX hydrolase [Pseudonocardia lacus]
MSAGRHEFTVRSSKDLHVGRVLALRADDVEMPGGRVANREVTEHFGAVAIAAMDVDGRLMMLHQYRHPVRRRLWELPAGLLDGPGEDPLAAAQRELTEETGLTATDWSVLVDVVPSPGFSDEAVRVFLARDVTEVGRPSLDTGDEEADMQTRWVSLPVAVRMVLDGKIVNGVSATAVLAAHALAGGAGRPVDAPWPDRPTRFAERRAADS